MQGAVLHAPRDIRVEQRDDPKIKQPTDAVIRVAATCVCGSDLWPYRGIEPVDGPAPMGHEYAGVVEEVGSDVRGIRPGQFVVGSFFASDNTCAICQAGYQSRCVHGEPMGAIGTQAQYARVPLADGTLVATPEVPGDDLVPSLLAASDVLGTGWFGAVAADVKSGKTVAVVGDGAVGLLAVLAARQLGAEQVIAVSRHEPRQKLARVFGATDIITERGDDGAARVRELTGGLGAHSVIEAVGTQLPGREHGEQADRAVTDDRDRLTGSGLGGDGAEPAGTQHVGGGEQARDQVLLRRARGRDQGAVRQRHPQVPGLSAARPDVLHVHAAALVAGLADRASVV